MIKGLQKNMVILKDTGSPIFEEAYFILKDRPAEERRESDMITEANRIIAANMISSAPFRDERPKRHGGKLKGFVWFIMGLLSGAVVTAAVFLIFC